MLDSYQIMRKKMDGQKITMMTAYDYFMAKILQEGGIDMILVGDSLANVVLGRPSTRDIGMQEMLLFVQAVHQGAPQTHIVADMPWMSDHTVQDGLKNAEQLSKAGASSVKMEGARYDVIHAVTSQVCPVVGHLGLTPQTATDFKQRGKSPEDAAEIVSQARQVMQAGAFCIVLEHIPSDLGRQISEEVAIPTIGIGAGDQCDGQVLVCYDALGLNSGKLPPFVKKFANLHQHALQGVQEYCKWVQKAQ
jgi:3-methyl-2-oxobutanoate hydroxymethyltransferase